MGKIKEYEIEQYLLEQTTNFNDSTDIVDELDNQYEYFEAKYEATYPNNQWHKFVGVSLSHTVA